MVIYCAGLPAFIMYTISGNRDRNRILEKYWAIVFLFYLLIYVMCGQIKLKLNSRNCRNPKYKNDKITKSMFYSICFKKYHKSLTYIHPRLKNDIECTICKCDFVDDDDIIEFPCKGQHCYHFLCILKWLEYKISCPTCNHKFVN